MEPNWAERARIAPIERIGLNLTLALTAASPFQGPSLEIGRDCGLHIVDARGVGHDELDAAEIEWAHGRVRHAPQRHVDQHAILDRVRHRADRVERA